LISRYRSLAPEVKARLWLGAAAIVLLLIVLFGGKPWDVHVEPGRKWRPGHYMQVWFWWAALGNFVLVGILALTSGLWAQPAPKRDREKPGERHPGWFFPGVIAAAVVLFASGTPRLGQSLWHDEANRVKTNMVGDYKERDNGHFEFRFVDWKDSLFYSGLPNHALQNILSKASHDVWLGMARPSGLPVNEAALRLPVLVASAAGLFALAVLLAHLGFPGAGVFAAWILALHPWFLRYASEARGYGLLMALLPVLVYAFLRAVETGRCRWWVAFALTQTAVVYTLVSAVFIPLVLNACALPYFWAMARQQTGTATTVRHWLVANICSAALFLQLYLPNIPQLLDFLDSEKGRGAGNVMNAHWLQNYFANLAAGIPWTHTFTKESPYIEMMPAWVESTGTYLVITGLLGLLVVGGLIRIVRSSPAAWLAMATLLLPAILSYAMTRLQGGFQFDWYLIYLLPGVASLAALALAWLPENARSLTTRRTGTLAATAALAAFAVWTHPQRTFLLNHSIQPYREAVLLTRPSTNPNAHGQNNILTAFFHAGPLTYDPRTIRCHSLNDITALAHRADTENKSLFFIIAYIDTTRAEHPEKYKLLEQSGLFEEIALLRGQVPSLSTHIFRYQPNSLQKKLGEAGASPNFEPGSGILRNGD
jgi:hypothetical protein